MEIAIFTFNPFMENTYVLWSSNKEAAIIDPGCNDDDERNQLVDLIEANQLKIKYLINTHCHIDHVLGNNFVSSRYNLPLWSHRGEVDNLSNQNYVSGLYGIPYDPSPPITKYLEEGDSIQIGEESLKILFCPGHSPAHICLYHELEKFVIGGDVLFQGSIGRTDLPGGNHDLLLKNIKEKLFTLPKETVVYPGHGPSTTIGEEFHSNPFF